MIYVITFHEKFSDDIPPVGEFFYMATENEKEAESLYSQLLLSKVCCVKTLWQINSKGVRVKLQSEDIYERST